MQTTLTAAGLIDKFENRMFSAYDIGKWKPDPGIFLHAAEQMKYKPHECLVVEDSRSGVQAAKNGGFDVIGFQHNHNAKQINSLNIPVIDDMMDLPLHLH